MTVKETILSEFEGYNVYKLDIDRKDDSTVYTVFMDNPLGYNTGKVKLEWELANHMKFDQGGVENEPSTAERIAHLMRRQVDVDIESFIKE